MITNPQALTAGLVGVRGNCRCTYIGRTPNNMHLVSIVDIDGSNEHSASYALDTVMLSDTECMAYVWGLPGDGIFYLDSTMTKGEPTSPTKPSNPRARQVNWYRRQDDGGPVKQCPTWVEPTSAMTMRRVGALPVTTAHMPKPIATYQRPSMSKWNRRAEKHARYWVAS